MRRVLFRAHDEPVSASIEISRVYRDSIAAHSAATLSPNQNQTQENSYEEIR